MKTLKFEKEIEAPAEKVYKTMLGLDDKKSYESWTAAFDPTSTYEGSWEKGEIIRFVGTDKDGNKRGMVSKIVENRPNSFVSIKHLGIFDGKNDVLEGPDVESWAGALENYSFDEQNGKTLVKVEMDITEEYADSFNKTWNNALERLKKTVEN